MALPQRSPSPFSVPWIWRAPARPRRTEFADGAVRCRYGRGCRHDRRELSSQSSPTMRSTSCGSVPPLVSHSTTQRAPRHEPPWRRRVHKRVGLIAVEVMLAVEQHFAALRLCGTPTLLRDRGEHFLLAWSRAPRAPDSPKPWRRADNVGRASRSATRPGSFDTERPGRRVMPNAAKRGRAWALLGEELGVHRIGAGIAAFDIVDAEPSSMRRDRQLVGEREIDAIGSARRRAAWCRKIKPRLLRQRATSGLTRDNSSTPKPRRSDGDERDSRYGGCARSRTRLGH